MSDDQPLLITRDRAVVILTINRPGAKNSLNEAVFTALRTALDDLRHDDSVRAVVLTGAEGVFCAGADITAFDALRDMTLFGPRDAGGASLWSDLGAFTKPVIAAIEGPALGGGCELALACDIAIAGDSARLGVPEVKLGVIPGGGGTQRLIRAVGKSMALSMLLSGDLIGAERACSAGLVSEVVPAGEALSTATALAHRIASNSPLAVALAKDAALNSLETTLSAGLEHEKRNFHIAIHSEDSRIGQAAFLARETPEFTGK